MRIAPLTSLPAGPDAVKGTSPPGAVLLGGTNAAKLTFAVSAGVVTLTPHWWNQTANTWIPAKASTTAVYSLQANAASQAVVNEIFPKASEPQWWMLLSAGGGTVSYCDIEETMS